MIYTPARRAAAIEHARRLAQKMRQAKIQRDWESQPTPSLATVKPGRRERRILRPAY
jgi:hypothetical protein